MANFPPNLHAIQGFIGHVHILVEGDRCVLIDTGMLGEVKSVLGQLRKLGLGAESIEAVLLTHGHLDHAGNLHHFKRISKARVFAHPEEQIHLDGKYPYRGVNRVCGLLEGIGRFATRYQSVKIDCFVKEGDHLPFWGGLRVLHLPGHTAGHCGYYSAQHDLLFAGDLFVKMFYGDFMPPAIFNSAPDLFRESYEKVKALNPSRILPAHYSLPDPVALRKVFDAIEARKFG